MKHHPPAGFIGRQRELDALDAALDRAAAGQPRVVLLAGEPGIGKTRTAQEIVAHAAARQVLALWGRCPEEPGAPPYWPWLQLLKRYAEVHGDAGREIAVLDPAHADTPAPTETDAGTARFRLFDVIAGFWRRAATQQPVLLVLDDLHRADVPSLRLLEFVMAEAGSSRLMLLGTYRDSEVTRQHALADTLAQLHRHTHVQRLLLGGFSADETAQFVAAAGVGSTALALLLHDQTEGHPLYLAELARDFIQRQGVQPLGGAAPGVLGRRVPKGVRALIGARLDHLTPPCRRVLQHAAVIGRVFSFELLCRLLDDMPQELGLAAIDEAQAASVIDEAADAGSYQFAHALVRDSLYDELPAARRAGLHQQITLALEAAHAHDLTPCLTALAHHGHAAGVLGDAAKTVRYATLAAERATALQAHEEAARHYLLALDASHAPAQRGALLVRLGEAQNTSGDSARAMATFTDAAACARRLGDVSMLAQAAIGVGNAQWRQGQEGTQAVLLIREALAATAGDESAERVSLLSAACRALLFSNRPDDAETAFHEAVGIARRLGDPLTLYVALSAIVPGRWFADRLDLRIAAAREGIALMRASPQLDWPVSTLVGWHTGDLMEWGDTAQALAAAQSHLQYSQTTRDPFNEATAVTALAMIATHEGRFADAERLALQALRCGERFDRANASGILGVQMFTLRRHQGRLRELAPVLQQFLAGQALAAIWRPGLAALHGELGALDQAREVFEGLAREGFAGIAQDAIRIASLVYLAEVCVQLQDATRAALLFELLLPFAERNIVFGAHTASFGAAGRVLGMLATTLQQWDAAQQHFEFALRLDERSGGLPWLALTRCEFAAMLLCRARPGDAERAQDLLTAAIEGARALGMQALQQRAERLQRQTVSGRTQPVHVAGLSEREVQVLCLVAAGKTNREIGAALHRSPATVAIHVRHILGKTQAANRAEAAAFAQRHGLLAAE